MKNGRWTQKKSCEVKITSGNFLGSYHYNQGKHVPLQSLEEMANFLLSSD